VSKHTINAIAPWLLNCRGANPAMQYALFLLGIGVLSVDNQGRFWRHATMTRRGTLWLKVPRRAESLSGKGYFRLTLYIPTIGLRSVQAHRVVWTKNHGQIPDEMQVNHKDLDKKNNIPSNLELLSQSGNIIHSYANGRRRPWSVATEWRPGILRISDRSKKELARLRLQGFGAHRISKKLGMSRTHAQRLIDRLETK
jgi:hypothetical protein